MRSRDRRRAAGGRARPAPDRTRPPAAADDAAGDPAGRAQGAPERAARPGRARPRRPTARCGGYSGGMKRRLDLALALVHRPQHPLPRRADDGPRPAEPHRALGGGRAARARGRRDRLPDDAVPRGGGRARRPGRDHRPRQDRRRGHAGRAEGRDRAPQRARDPAPARTTGRRSRSCSARFGEPLGGDARPRRAARATASGWPT